jgi:hypothetical protein
MLARAFRLLSLPAALFFLVAMILQYNDPDWPAWFAVYGLATILAFLFWSKRAPSLLAALLGLMSLGWSIWLATGVIGRQPLMDEEGREMMGLAIVAIWMAGIAGAGRREQKP